MAYEQIFQNAEPGEDINPRQVALVKDAGMDHLLPAAELADETYRGYGVEVVVNMSPSDGKYFVMVAIESDIQLAELFQVLAKAEIL